MRAMAWVVAGLVLGSALGSAAAGPDDARAGVDEGNRAFKAALLRGDAKAIGDLYTVDAQVVAPDAPVTRGRAAIVAFWQRQIDAGVKDLTLKTVDLETHGDVAVETGSVRLVVKDGTAVEARYLVVWKRTDGTWKLHRDIWNAE